MITWFTGWAFVDTIRGEKKTLFYVQNPTAAVMNL